MKALRGRNQASLLEILLEIILEEVSPSTGGNLEGSRTGVSEA